MASGAKGLEWKYPAFALILKYRRKTPFFGLKIARDFRGSKQIKRNQPWFTAK